MKTNLTLSLDKSVIKKAKSYAKKQNKSLSKIVENYFNLLFLYEDKKNNKATVVAPITKSLAGI